MPQDDRNVLLDGQFSLAFIISAITYSCVLVAMIANRSAIGCLMASLVGMCLATRVAQKYLRRSVIVFFAGVGVIAFATHVWWPVVIDTPMAHGIILLGTTLVFAGGFGTLVNAFDR